MTDESILIVEPDEILQKTVSAQLLSYGFKPLAAKNPKEGLKFVLNGSPPQLLLLHWPLDGALYFLRSLFQAGSVIPTILVAAQELTNLPLEFLRLGVRDYLEQPFTTEQLAAVIQRVLPMAGDAPNYRRVAEGLDRINRTLEQRVKEFDLLFKIGRSVNSLLDLDAALNRITEAAVFITGAEEGYLLLLDDEMGELRLRAAQNLGEKHARGFSLPVSDSIAGQVVRSAKPVLLGGDGRQNFKVKTGYLVKSLLNVPLKADGRVLGVLGVDNQVSNAAFTQLHLNSLLLLADIAVISLDNARQYTTMRQRLARQVKEFATLQAIAGQLSTVTDFDMRARLALSLILNTINAEAGVLAWSPGQDKEIPLYITQGALGDLVLSRHTSAADENWWNDQALQEVLTTGQPVLKNNFKFNGNSSRSQLAVPMRRGNQVIGVINIESAAPHLFTQTDLHFVSSVANQVAIALESTLLQEKAEADRQRLFMLMSAIDYAVWLVDSDLNVVAQNEAAAELVGRSPAEVIGYPVYDLLPANGHSSQQLRQLFSQAITQRQPLTFDKEVTLVTKENITVAVRGKVTPLVRGDQVAGAVCTLQKVIPGQGDNLMRLEFANMASHLLRTPLCFIQTSIDLMLNSDLAPAEQQTTLNRMWDRSRSLSEFTDELLEMLRVETEPTRTYVEPVALRPLLGRVLNLVQDEKTEHVFNFTGSDRWPVVAADATKTELILFNLLTNALTRCPVTCPITIKPEIGSDNFSLAIIDAGEPIPPRQLERIFEQFYPVDDDNGKMPSTYQLGLYTARRLVELQNGRIWAVNQPGGGVEFGFSLPLWEKQE